MSANTIALLGVIVAALTFLSGIYVFARQSSAGLAQAQRDAIARAVAEATKPLQERINDLNNETAELRTQKFALETELRQERRR